MYCPICKGEFREGFEECTNCQVNLVEDLDNITEQVRGEIKLCVACEIEAEPEAKRCPSCGMKLIRAVLHDDTYVFLEKPPEDVAESALIPDVEEEQTLKKSLSVNSNTTPRFLTTKASY